MFTGFALYEAGRPWVDSMSKSHAYRRMSNELLCAVCFYMFVYVYDVPCMRGEFAHLGDMIGRWLAWLALIQRFDW